MHANIECELLTCVFGAEWFHTCVFGHPFTIESVHKPPEQINIKNLTDHQFICTECCYNSKTMMSPSSIDLANRCWLQMSSLTMHPSRLQRYLETSPWTMCTSCLTEKLSSRLSSKMACSSAPFPRWSSHVGRWYQWCPICSMPKSWTQKHPNSWRWPHSLRWSSHPSSIRKGENSPSNTWRTHGNQQVPKQSQTLCVLAWNQLRH